MGIFTVKDLLNAKKAFHVPGVSNTFKKNLLNHRPIERVLEGTLRYQELHQTSLVPLQFIVPKQDKDWPAYWHNKHLGKMVHKTRQLHKKQQIPKADVTILNQNGFVLNEEQHYWEKRTMPSLLRYKELHGDITTMEDDYIVPDGEGYPKMAIGFNLGKFMRRLFLKEVYQGMPVYRRLQLVDLGFSWDTEEDIEVQHDF